MSRDTMLSIYTVLYCLFYVGLYLGVGFGCFILSKIINAKLRDPGEKPDEDDIFSAPLGWWLFLWPLMGCFLILIGILAIFAGIGDKASELGDKIGKKIDEDIGQKG